MVIDAEVDIENGTTPEIIEEAKADFFKMLSMVKFTNETSEKVIREYFANWFDDYTLRDMQREDLKASAMIVLDQNCDTDRKTGSFYDELEEIIEDL